MIKETSDKAAVVDTDTTGLMPRCTRRAIVRAAAEIGKTM
jgi:hypothetical protein